MLDAPVFRQCANHNFKLINVQWCVAFSQVNCSISYVQNNHVIILFKQKAVK